MDFLRLYYREFALIILLFAAFSDGVLAVLSFMAATSRTIYAMAKNNMLPHPLSRTRDGHPFNAVLTTIFAYSLAVVPSLALAGRPFELFLVYGSLAGMANLFVHISADVSFVIQESRTMKRALTYSSLRFTGWIIRRSLLIIVGLAATAYSIWTLTLSMESRSISGETYLFLLWIIIGFIYAEVIDELMGRVSQSQSS
jgi:amino acid transporter